MQLYTKEFRSAILTDKVAFNGLKFKQTKNGYNVINYPFQN